MASRIFTTSLAVASLSLAWTNGASSDHDLGPRPVVHGEFKIQPHELPQGYRHLTGGGPITGGGPSPAEQRLVALFPTMDPAEWFQFNSVQAAAYISENDAIAPILNLAAITPALDMIENVGSCMLWQGIADARVYIHRYDPAFFGAMLIVSQEQATDFPALLTCGLPVLGGGPGGPGTFQPCWDRYKVMTYDGYTFWIAYVGSNEWVCNEMTKHHPDNVRQPW